MSVFFFKQKTAYEMRISDWSSDVCSSDLSANWWRAGWRRRRAEDPLPARRRDRGRCCSWSPCFLRRHSLKRKVSVKRRPSVSYSSPLVCDGYTDARVGDRKSVVSGTRGLVRVALGGRTITNKTKNHLTP